MESVVRDPGRSGRLPLMDGCRGMAALFVMVRHTDDFWPFDLYRSYLAVDVFFLLSGFVISRAYGNRLRAGELSTARFMAIRLIRLYPMFLLSGLFAGAMFVAASVRHGQFGALSALSIVFTLFMLPFKLAGSILLFPLDGAYWSLFFEVIANWFYARVVRLFAARAMAALVGVAAVVLVVDALDRGDLNIGFSWGLVPICGGLARAAFGIFLGAMLERHGARSRLARAARTQPWLALATMLLVLVSPSVGALNGLADVLAVLVVFPVCVLALDAPVANMPVARTLMLLGAASYPLYVLHLPASAATMRVFYGGMATHALAIGVAFTLALVPLCIALERFVDEPVRRWLQKRLPAVGRRDASAGAGAVVLAFEPSQE